jgi:ABC-type molybdate transport system ATPase subunit
LNDKLQAQAQHYTQIKVLGNAIMSLPLIGVQGSVIQTFVFCHCRQYRVTHLERASFSIKVQKSQRNMMIPCVCNLIISSKDIMRENLDTELLTASVNLELDCCVPIWI